MAPGFQNGKEELRTRESVAKDYARPGADGDSRPLDEAIDPAVEKALDEDRGLKIDQRLRDKDRAGVR